MKVYVRIVSAVLITVLMLSLSVSVSASKRGRVFTYNTVIESVPFNSRAAGQASLSHLWRRGYDAGEFLNNTAAPIYNTLPTSNVMLIVSDAAAGVLNCSSTTTSSHIWATGNHSENDKSLSSYASNGLAYVDMAVYLGVYTGKTGTNGGNLVDVTIAKGADIAIGWKSNVDACGDGQKWINVFFKECADGETVNIAYAYAKGAMRNESLWSYDKLVNIYYGNSRMNRAI